MAVLTVEEPSSPAPGCCGIFSDTVTGAEESVGPLAAAVTLGAKGTEAQPEIGTGGVAGFFGDLSPLPLSSSRKVVESPLQGLGMVRKSPPAWPLKTSRLRSSGGNEAMLLIVNDS